MSVLRRLSAGTEVGNKHICLSAWLTPQLHCNACFQTLILLESPTFKPDWNVCNALLLQERMNLARQIEKAEFFNSRAKQHDSWLQQAAEALEVDLDDDLFMGK